MATTAINALSPHDLLGVCTGGDQLITETLGAPPDPNLRLDIADCPGDKCCTVCPAGSISNPEGACVPCPFVIEGDTCQQCPADVTIDGNAAPLTAETFSTTTQAPNDTCPDIFWLQVNNPQGFFNRGAIELSTSVDLSNPTSSTCAQTYELTSEPESGGEFLSSSDQDMSAAGTFCSASNNNLCFTLCSGLPSFEFTSTSQLPQGGGTFENIRYGTAAVSGVDLVVNVEVALPPPP
jgi:hypothetical protein